MLGFLKENVIGQLRRRRKWTQTELAGYSGLDKFFVSRFETHVRSPRDKAFASMMRALDLPEDTLFCPCLDTSSIHVFGLKDQLLHELQWGIHYPERLKKAENLLMELSGTDGFDVGINKQFILSCTARLYEAQGKHPGEILDITKEGLATTYPEFDPETFRGDMLLFCEPELIHSRALAYRRMGNTDKSIGLLRRMSTGLARLPQDDRSKESLLAPVLLDLSRLLLDTGYYDHAMNACEEGMRMSNKRNKGKYTPDFTFIKAKALHKAGSIKESEALFLSACASFSLMRKQNAAKEVKEYANRLGISFETFDMENQPVNVPNLSVEHGSVISCKTLGEFFYGLRAETGMTIAEACEGICNKSILNRLENNSKSTSIFNLEALLQRYGRCTNKYFTPFLSLKDFDILQLRNRINLMLATGQYAEAEAHLGKLADVKLFKRGMNLQYIKLAEAQIYNDKHGYNDRCMEMLKDAWLTTRKVFDEDSIAKTRLSYSEIVITNLIGLHMCESGELRRGVRLLESLCNSMKHYYVDESARIRMYPAVLYNLSKFMGRMGARNDAYALALEGDELCTKHGDFDMLSSFAINRAVNLSELGDKEKSVPIFAQAFYSAGLLGEIANQVAIRQYVKERLGINLDV
ncbi:MAG: helix-turn-helix domain-containing protein [Defluviitaleaceae bacterium]|nr:helix-turn-helix domain-containing protein [Defluviitaleaceae bacterium]